MAAEPHAHADNDSFYLDQLCLIGICGAFAAICLTLYFVRLNMLRVIFGPLDQTWFGDFTLWSGIVLGVLVVLRAIAVWRSVGDPALRDMHANHDHGYAHHPHMHPHEEDHAHHHEHGHCDHHHDHDHAHGTCDHDHAHEHPHATAGVQAALPQSALQQGLTTTPSPVAAHDHKHDDHDHGWAPWRYAVLLVPVALYLLGLPNQGRAVKGVDDVDTTQEVANFASTIALGPNPLLQVVRLGATTGSQATEVRIVIGNQTGSISDLKPGMKVFVKEGSAKASSGHKIIGSNVEEIRDAASTGGKPGFLSAVVKEVYPEDKSVLLEVDRQGNMVPEHINLAQGPVFGMDFKTLEALALDETRRNKWDGKMVQVVGQFAPNPRSNQVFSLARLRIQCCSADAVQLNVPILAAEPITNFDVNDWVQVVGRVEFRKKGGRWNTVLFVDRKSQVRRHDPEPDLYIR